MHRKLCLTTPRLTLRPLEDRDMDAMIRLLKDPRIRATYMIPDFADRTREEAYFRRLQALSADDSRFVFGIRLEDRLIGFLNDCEMDGEHAELGYFIDPAHWGRGYAAEALRAAIGELFRIGFRQVTAGYFEENPASRRVMEKCGMTPLPGAQSIDYRGVSHRCLYLKIDRQDP